MKSRWFNAAWASAIVVLSCAWPATAQDGEQGDDELPPPPPVVLRLVEVAKDPEKFRQLMADPQRVAAVMDALDNDAVREFMRDPRRVAVVMQQVDMQQIRDAVQSVDRGKVREAMLSRWKLRLKQQLGAGDEEWKVLEPLILKVVRVRRDARLDPPRTVGGGRAAGAAAPEVPGDGPSKVDEAEAALRESAGDPDVHDNDVGRSLGEFRRARDAARQSLDLAEHDLKALLTQRQEGILIVMGILR